LLQAGAIDGHGSRARFGGPGRAHRRFPGIGQQTVERPLHVRKTRADVTVACR